MPGAAPVARAPYRLAPSEMKELSEQLQELSDKGFIRPSSLTWELSVIGVCSKDLETLLVQNQVYGVHGDRIVDRLSDTHNMVGPAKSGESCRGNVKPSEPQQVYPLPLTLLYSISSLCYPNSNVVTLGVFLDTLRSEFVEALMLLVGMDRLSKMKFKIEHGVHLKFELELLRKEKLYAKVTSVEGKRRIRKYLRHHPRYDYS
ncbi:hypothetical protein Tco_0415438 [Tanacetum coccineum]